MYESQITAAAMILAFFLIVAGLMGMLTYYEGCIHSHGMLMMAGTAITGLGICLFRLMRGRRTSIVKYVHMGVLLIAGAFFLGGLIVIKGHNRSKHVHAFAGSFGLILLVVQVIMGIFLFTYLYNNRNLRVNLSPLHDVFGIFLYLSFVGIIFAGHHGLHPLEIYYELKTKIFNTVALAGFMIIVPIILSPYFEWELVQ